MSKKQIKFFHKIPQHVRKRDGETVYFAMKVTLTVDEAAILEDLFLSRKDEGKPSLSLFRAFMLQMAEGNISEETVIKKAAWVKTISTLSSQLSESDCLRALSFIKSPPTKSTADKKNHLPASPHKPRRVFIP